MGLVEKSAFHFEGIVGISHRSAHLSDEEEKKMSKFFFRRQRTVQVKGREGGQGEGCPVQKRNFGVMGAAFADQKKKTLPSLSLEC